ncbi:MAG: DNA recombination protein RmuC, partial [Gammaproteobacteria bacterium]|nr:DNA recombination protein RmuC [Gammaproteobacteria bacterium]
TLAEQVQSFQREIDQLKDTLSSLQNTLASKEDALKQSISNHLKLTGENSTLAEQVQSFQREIDQLKDTLSSQKNELKDKEQHIEALKQDKSNLNTERESLKAQTEAKTQALEETLHNLKHAKEEMTNQFKVLAIEILKQEGSAFAEQNKGSLEGIAKGVRDTIEDLRKKTEDLHQNSALQQTELTSQLKEQLKQQIESTQQLNKEATALTDALKVNNKRLGNWGEQILERILEYAEFKKGVHYESQKRLAGNDELGKNAQIPDIVVYLPEKKSLIIDSKVSLKNYIDYVNAPDPVSQKAYMDLHLKSLRNHIKDLGKQSYQNQKEITNSPDLVFMFVPAEGAFVEALKADPELIKSASQGKVWIVSPTTLLSSLQIVHQLWNLHHRSEQAEDIHKLTDRIYAKLGTFFQAVDEIGKGIEKAKNSYDNARKRFMDGKGNALDLYEGMKKLTQGNKGVMELSEDIPDELGESSQNKRITLNEGEEFVPSEGQEGENVLEAEAMGQRRGRKPRGRNLL